MTNWIKLRFPWLVDQINYFKLILQIRKKFRATENPWQIQTTSRDYYNSHDDREHEAYFENNLTLCRVGKKNQMVRVQETRIRYLEPVFQQIDILLSAYGVISVLEVGCGNCINLVEIQKRYGSRVQLTGFDISSLRIERAKKAFSEELKHIPLTIDSVTLPISADQEEQYDLVFSMHCLEQIPYAVAPAIENMWKRSRKVVVFIEPVWEFARPVQKLRLVRSDFIRTLLPTIRSLGYDVIKAEPLGFETSQKNQSSVIVVAKA